MAPKLNLVDLGEVEDAKLVASGKFNVATGKFEVATGKFEVATGKFEVATGKFEIVTDDGPVTVSVTKKKT